MVECSDKNESQSASVAKIHIFDYTNVNGVLRKNIRMIESDPEAATDDGVLWGAFRNGNREAFEVIYRRYSDALYNYGVHIFLDRKIVEDAIQDLFIELWKRKEFLGSTNSIKFYLFKSLRLKVVRILQTEKYSSDVPTRKYTSLIEQCVEQHMISAELQEDAVTIISNALVHLPERQRQIILYRFFEDMSASEIAAVMSMTVESTYTLLSRALAHLRTLIRNNPLIGLSVSFFMFL